MADKFSIPTREVVLDGIYDSLAGILPDFGAESRVGLPSRANIWAMKSLGVKYIISSNACGSLREDFVPRHIVIPNQLFDHTRSRDLTFYKRNVVVHPSVAEPFEPGLCELLYAAVEETGATVHKGGTFIVIEGPRFSTKGESNIYRQWGCDLIGMTTVPEAFLALEAEIAYDSMAHVTDFDVWHETEEAVTVDAIIATLNANVEVAKQAIRNVVAKLADEPDFPSHHALETAIISRRKRSYVPDDTWEKLELFIGKYYR